MKYSSQWEPNGPYGIVKDTDVAGGFHVVADDIERNNIPLLRQKVGMHVYVQATSQRWRLTSTGNPPLTGTNFELDASASGAAAHHTGIVSGCAITNPSANNVTLSVGVLAHRGQQYAVDVALNAPAPTGTGDRALVFDTLTQTLIWRTHMQCLKTDLPLVYAAVLSGLFQKYEVIAPASVLGANPYEEVIVMIDADASPAAGHFTSLHHAMLWVYAHGNLDTGPRLVTAVGEYAVVDERADLPGNIVNVDTGTGVVTGSGTRFQRDFAVGDWIGLGGTAANNRTWGQVAAVTTDTTLTVTSVTAVTTPAVYSRAKVHGPHAETLSPDCAGLSGEIHGIHLRGVTTDPSADRGPLIEWGFRKTSGVSPNNNNVPIFGLGSNNRRWKISNFQWSYKSRATDLDYDACMIKGVGRENDFEALYLEGDTSSPSDAGLNCLVNISNNPYPDVGNPSVTFRRCVLENIGGSTFTERTSVRVTASTGSGQVRFVECAVQSSAQYLIAEDDSATAATIDFIFDNCSITLLSPYALIKHRHTSSSFSRVLRFSQCRIFALKVGVVSTADQTTDLPHIDLIECVFSGGMDYTGARQVSGILLSGAHALNSAGSFDVYATLGASITGTPLYLHRRDTGEFRVGAIAHATDPVDSVSGVAGLHFLSGQDRALTTTFGGQCSRIIAGGDFSFDGTTVTLKPGTFRFADGSVLNKTTNTTLAAGLGSGTGPRYLYLNFGGTLSVSSTAPNVFGHDGTNTRVYVGSIMSDGGSVSACRVVTLGGTQRLVSMQDSGLGDASYIGNHITASTQTATSFNMYDTTNNGANTGASSPRTTLPTARTLRWAVNMFWTLPVAETAPAGGVGSISWSAGGLKPLPFYFPSSTFWRGRFSGAGSGGGMFVSQTLSWGFETINANSPSLSITIPSGWEWLAYASLIGYTEDVNQPTPWL